MWVKSERGRGHVSKQDFCDDGDRESTICCRLYALPSQPPLVASLLLVC